MYIDRPRSALRSFWRWLSRLIQTNEATRVAQAHRIDASENPRRHHRLPKLERHLWTAGSIQKAQNAHATTADTRAQRAAADSLANAHAEATDTTNYTASTPPMQAQASDLAATAPRLQAPAGCIPDHTAGAPGHAQAPENAAAAQYQAH